MSRDCTLTVPHADDESRSVPCGLPAIVSFEGHNPTRWLEEPFHGALCSVHCDSFLQMGAGEVVTFTRLGDAGDNSG